MVTIPTVTLNDGTIFPQLGFGTYKLTGDDGIAAIGSGGAYAQAAARALTQHTSLSAEDVVRQSLAIAGEICIYTNMNHTIETLD